MPEPARNVGFLIENRTRRDVNFSIGASDEASAIGVVEACTTEVVPGATVREGDGIVLSDGGEVWRFNSLPSEDIGGMLLVVRLEKPTRFRWVVTLSHTANPSPLYQRRMERKWVAAAATVKDGHYDGWGTEWGDDDPPAWRSRAARRQA